MLTVQELNSWYTPKQFMNKIKEEKEEECVYCNGTGIVDAVEAVYPGEPHQAHVGSRQCVCQMGDEDDWDE